MTNWGIFNAALNSKQAGTNDYITNLISDATPNTKGSYVEIVSSTPFDSECLIIEFNGISYGGYDHLFDIAAGGSGSEVDIISNIVAGHSTAYHLGRRYEFPLKIKAGTRLSGRSQGEYSGAQNFRIAVHLMRGSWNYPRGFAVCDTYGANTADSGGVSIDPGATINTKGAWSEITSSLTRDIKGFILGIDNKSDYAKSSTSYYWNVDVGVGGSGSEVVVFGDWTLTCHSGGDQILPCVTPFIPVNIPSGSRLSVRAACDNNSATYRTFDAVIYTFS